MSSKLIFCHCKLPDTVCKTHIQAQRVTNSFDLWKKKTIIGVGDRKFQLDSFDIYVLLSSVIKRDIYFLIFSADHFWLPRCRICGGVFLSYSSWTDTEDRASTWWHPASVILLTSQPSRWPSPAQSQLPKCAQLHHYRSILWFMSLPLN